MRKNPKTKFISTILKDFSADERRDIVNAFDKAMIYVDCQGVKWQEFEVFPSSIDFIKKVLEKKEFEFLMSVALLIKHEDAYYHAQIVVKPSVFDNEMWSTRINDTVLVFITVSNDVRERLLENKNSANAAKV